MARWRCAPEAEILLDGVVQGNDEIIRYEGVITDFAHLYDVLPIAQHSRQVPGKGT